MRYLSLLCLLFVASITITNAQIYDKSCYYGITFEISENPSWGYGELVITRVEPNSPAEKAGIKKGDIIMEIDGQATYLRDNQTIADWLYNAEGATVEFSIRNVNSYFKKFQLEKNCVSLNSINEKELSNIFSFYSLESTNEQKFALPVNIDINNDVDYSDYHTFGFQLDELMTDLDGNIMRIISDILESKGLTKDDNDPDLIVQTYYNYEPNPLYTAADVDGAGLLTWRYDAESKKMLKLPILDPKTADKEQKAQYIASFGVSFYDSKNINPEDPTLIWDCKIVDYASTSYPFDLYLNIHIPLVLMEYPYSKEKDISEYKVSYSKFNYTGIHFDVDDLSIIRDVDRDSPAYKAGIRSGYVIKKINNREFKYSKEELSVAYKQFISETMKYRNQSTQFTSADGYSECMLWNPVYYSEIAKAFKKSEYLTHFAFLYNFEKFINSNSNNSLTIEAWDGYLTRTFTIIPELRQSVEVASR